MTANGFPKAGNHALIKALELLGLPVSVNHIPYPATVDEPHLFIVRDPRNVLLSAMRFTHKPITEGTIIAAFRRFPMDRDERSLVASMADYEPWLTRADVIRYEALVADDREHRRIASIVGVPYLDGAWEHLPGHTMTWHAEHSDWQAVWTDNIARVWRDEGGDELLGRWGYGTAH